MVKKIIGLFFGLVGMTNLCFAEDYFKWTPLQISLFSPVQLFSERADVYGARLNLLYGKSRNVWGFDIGTVNQTEDMYGIQGGLLANNVEGDLGGFQVGTIGNFVGGKVTGIQLSVMNQVKGPIIGFQLGLYCNVSGGISGIQVSIIANGKCAFEERVDYHTVKRTSITGYGPSNGVQIAIGGNAATRLRGIQLALFSNYARDSATGIQLGAFNISEETYGFQLGMLNFTDEVNGLQIGYFNKASNVNGFQIGMINYAKNLVGIQIGLLNIHRNGLLFFPGINIGW